MFANQTLTLAQSLLAGGILLATLVVLLTPKKEQKKEQLFLNSMLHVVLVLSLGLTLAGTLTPLLIRVWEFLFQ